MRTLPCALLLTLAAAVACDEATAPENTGAVRITVGIAGLDGDTDGLTVTVDDRAPITITPPGSAVVVLDMGHHTLSIGDLAPNCSLNGPNNRSFAVNAADTAEVAVVVSCTSLTGVIEVRAPTTGLDADPDGYAVSLDGGPDQGLPLNGVTWFSGVSAGTHSVSFSGSAPNCSGASANPVEVSVAVGGLVRDTAEVAFAVTCSAVTGVIEVRALTSGPDPDIDGYGVSVDGGPVQVLPSNGVIWFLGVAGGPHSLSFSGSAAHCTATGSNPVVVSVDVGGLVRDTALVSRAVTCPAVTAVVEVSATTTGHDPDADGYVLSLDGGPAQVLPPNGKTWFTGLAGGVHSLSFGGLATHCTAAESSPVSVSVSVGGMVRDTGHVSIAVSCTTTTGALRVSAVATGVNPDASFLVTLDAGAPAPLAAGSTLLIDRVAPGDHSILLSDVASNCTVESPNPAPATVVIGDTLDVGFDIACFAAPPRTGVDVVVTTTGSDIPATYYLYICGLDDYYCYYTYTWEGAVPANGTVALDLPADDYYYYLTGVTVNCTGATSGSFAISNQQVTTLPLALACEPTARVRVAAPTTGPNAPSEYTVSAGDGIYASLPANGSTVTLAVHSGSHPIELQGVPFNCVVAEANPTTVNVAAGTTVDVTFHVTCTQPGSVVVSAPTSGVDLDAWYDVYIDGVYRATLNAGSVTPALAVAAGSHSVALEDIAPNCTVAGSNPATVTVAPGGTTNVSFPVTCIANPTLRVTVTTTGPNAPASYLVGVDPYCDYGYCYYLYSAGIPPNGTVSISLPPGGHTVTLDQVPLNCTVTSPNNVGVNVPLGTTTDLGFSVTCH